MIKKYAFKFLITIIGIMLIGMGVIYSTLGIIGEKTTGIITDVRREMGERNDSKPGNYTYSIGYSFELPNGIIVFGSTKKISDGIYIKNPNTIVAVRYLKSFPQINALQEDTELNIGKLILIALGIFIILIV